MWEHYGGVIGHYLSRTYLVHLLLLFFVLLTASILYNGPFVVICTLVIPLKIEPHVRILANELCTTPSQSNWSRSFPSTTNILSEHQIISQIIRRGKPDISNTCQLPPPLREYSDGGNSSLACARMMPSQGKCFHDSAGKIHKEKHLCHEQNINICEIKIADIKTGDVLVQCHNMCSGQLFLGSSYSESGQIQWNHVKSVSLLEMKILRIITSHSFYWYSGFCFIRCTNLSETVSKMPNRIGNLTQLLIFPPNIVSSDFRSVPPLNVNLIYLDSISRTQFFSSFPQTVVKLKDYLAINASVIDFDFVQSITKNSEESLNILLSGGYGEYDYTVKPQIIFESLQKLGYKTLWLDDSCWQDSIKIPIPLSRLPVSDRHTKVQFSRLRGAAQMAHITNMGPTIANCDIDQSMHFDAVMNNQSFCHNGIFLHEYHLQYLRYFQTRLCQKHIPNFSVFMADFMKLKKKNAVYFLDRALSEYVDFSTELPNMLTLIVSGHGHQPEDYTNPPFDEHLDSSNPLLIMILPASLRNTIGRDKISTLMNNQHRLVTILDVHHTLRSFWRVPQSNLFASLSQTKKYGDFNPHGLLEAIDLSRTCHDFPMTKSNLCLCVNHKMSVINDSNVVMVAEFALGKLNSLLQDQFLEAVNYFHKHKEEERVISTCRRLIGIYFHNVTQVYTKFRHLITRMTISLQPAVSSSVQVKEEIRVTVVQQIEPDITTRSTDTKLVYYRRISPYKQNVVCTGGAVQVNLCICDPTNDQVPFYNFTSIIEHIKTPRKVKMMFLEKFNPKSLVEFPPVVFGSETIVHNVDPNDPDKCFYIVYRTHDSGASFEAVNLCEDRVIYMSFNIHGERLIYSDLMSRVEFTLMPMSVKYLGVVSQPVVVKDWVWKYEVDFSGKYL